MADEGWSDEYVEANGIRFHCVTQGEGDLVILLHGFPEFWYSWRHQIPFLARRFKVVAPDMRGYGETDKPAGIESYDASKLTADVAGLIDAFGYKKAHIVGHDWGGAVAWLFAAAYPDRVDRLAVLNAPHPAVFAENALHNPRQMLRSWYMLFFQLPKIPEAALKAFDCFAVKRSFTDWAINKGAFNDEDLARYAEAACRPGALTGGLNYYRAMLRNRKLFEQRKDFPKIKSPTLLIWAEEDRALGKELTFGLDPYFSDGIEIKYIPNCSHWVQQERPLLVNQFLDDFL